MTTRRMILSLIFLLFVTGCGSRYVGEIVCEPNGGPCHSASARVLPLTEDEVVSLYFAPDIYSRAQGRMTASAGNRWGTLFTPDRDGVFFTQATNGWDGTVPETCGTPGRFLIGSTTEREPSILTKDCAVYIAAPTYETLVRATTNGLRVVCVTDTFAVTNECEGAAGVFATRPHSALRNVRIGDALVMPPINSAAR